MERRGEIYGCRLYEKAHCGCNPYGEGLQYSTSFRRGYDFFTAFKHYDGESVRKEIHSAGKKAFIHVDFAEGIGKDRFGLEFLAKQGVDGILTTRTNIVKAAKEFDLITVQRFFMVDSHSIGTSVESIKISKPDIIEIMPGIITKKIREFSQKVDMPIIAGGIVETMDEVREALAAGATVVSTGEAELWSMEI